MGDWNFNLEWKPQDLWVGIFWKRKGTRFDLWICILPCLPLHFYRWDKDIAVHDRAKEIEMDDSMMNDYESHLAGLVQQPETQLEYKAQRSKQQSETPRYSCLWQPSAYRDRAADTSYITGCGLLEVYKLGPFERGFKFCPYCGGELLVAPKQQDMQEVFQHLDDIESVMGGRNGSSIRLRTLVEQLKQELEAEKKEKWRLLNLRLDEIKKGEVERWKEMHDAVRWGFQRVLKEAELARACCDKLALALVNHKHLWTAEERNSYDKAFEGYEITVSELAPQPQQEGKVAAPNPPKEKP